MDYIEKLSKEMRDNQNEIDKLTVIYKNNALRIGLLELEYISCEAKIKNLLIKTQIENTLGTKRKIAIRPERQVKKRY